MKNYTSIYEKPFDNHLKPKETIFSYKYVQPCTAHENLEAPILYQEMEISIKAVASEYRRTL